MISSSYVTLAIVLMALITFSMRYFFFNNSFNIHLSDNVKNVLSFTAPCVLIAMVVPIMFQEWITTQNISAIFTSSYMIAGIFCIVISMIIRHTLSVILLSMVIFYGLRFLGL